jgi:chromatin segregation and condensation protein Rec8/ScpA/Scc1 (kleisin family)
MKRNDSKVISRLKKMYREFRDFFKENGEPCDSITEFLKLKWVKKLKSRNTSKHPLDKLDAKQKNRKERHSKKQHIQKEIECESCELFNYCNKDE